MSSIKLNIFNAFFLSPPGLGESLFAVALVPAKIQAPWTARWHARIPGEQSLLNLLNLSQRFRPRKNGSRAEAIIIAGRLATIRDD